MPHNDMNEIEKLSALYIATLKVMTLTHQHNHWLSKGDTFYADHLLLQRIYESASQDLDAAAEKMVGLLGDNFMDYAYQANLISKLFAKYSKLEGMNSSLQVEKDFVKLSKTVYDAFEKAEKMTLGLDDLIMAISDNREESIYLLGRVSL